MKDLIKSKGEWISSVDMENALIAHPGVMEAAVVARPDPKRDEVPTAFVVTRDDPLHPVTAEDLLRFLEAHFARWQLPKAADIHFVTDSAQDQRGQAGQEDAPPAGGGDVALPSIQFRAVCIRMA